MCVIERSPVIETRRLALRAPALSDAPRLASLANDFDLVRMTTSMPWPYRVEDAQAFVERSLAVDRRAENPFVIELEDEGVVGVLGFHPNTGSVDVGYWIGRPWQGRGLATEALTGALVWASREWRKRMIIASHFADNPASGEVLCKAGFLYTGERKPLPSKARGEPVEARMMIWLA